MSDATPINGNEPQLSDQSKRLIVMVLDASGSMAMAAEDVIGGFDSYVADRRNDPAADRTYLMVSIFKTGHEGVIVDIVAPELVANVPSLRERYAIGGMTPLYDAMGRTMQAAENFLAAADDFNPNDVTYITFTDGEENQSREYTREGVFALLQAKQTRGWAVVHLGAGAGAFREGSNMGVVASNVANYDIGQTRRAFNVVSRSTEAYYSDGSRKSRAGGQSVSFLSDDDRSALLRDDD